MRECGNAPPQRPTRLGLHGKVNTGSRVPQAVRRSNRPCGPFDTASTGSAVTWSSWSDSSTCRTRYCGRFRMFVGLGQCVFMRARYGADPTHQSRPSPDLHLPYAPSTSAAFTRVNGKNVLVAHGSIPWVLGRSLMSLPPPLRKRSLLRSGRAPDRRAVSPTGAFAAH